MPNAWLAGRVPTDDFISKIAPRVRGELDKMRREFEFWVRFSGN